MSCATGSGCAAVNVVDERTEGDIFPSYPSPDIHRRVLVLKQAGAGSPVPSEESPSLRPHGCSSGRAYSSATCGGMEEMIQ